MHEDCSASAILTSLFTCFLLMFIYLYILTAGPSAGLGPPGRPSLRAWQHRDPNAVAIKFEASNPEENIHDKQAPILRPPITSRSPHPGI